MTKNEQTADAKAKTKKKCIAIGVLTPIVALLLAFFVLCAVTMGMYSPAFLGRVLTHWDSSVDDYKIFPERQIEKSDSPYVYAKEINASLDNVTIEYNNKQSTLHEFIQNTDTTSLIVVKDDKIIFEQYGNGYDAMSVNTSFSMAKSVVSLLVGKAIKTGYIQSVNEPISNYIHEFTDQAIGKITIQELLSMRSSIVYDESKFLWFGDDSLTYWHTDLRDLALQHTQLTAEYGGKFHYNNYHPLLLGLILERSTGLTVSQWFEREIWRPIGAEYNASWSLDSEKTGFEKMESGINFRAIDFVKIGSMVLHNGYWNGTQIINQEWLARSTLCSLPIDNDEYRGTFLEDKNIGYQYMWYSMPSIYGGRDVFAWGKSDQLLYISPDTDIVILRTGKTDGGVDNWPALLQSLTKSLA